MTGSGDRQESMRHPHDHAAAAGSPGAGTSEQGERGESTVGDEGAAAGPESFVDPTGEDGPTS